MIIKVTSASNIIGFPPSFIGFPNKHRIFVDDGVAEVQAFIDEEITPKINSECAEGWTLTFRLVFTPANFSGIGKRGINYLSAKEKEFGIIIPIPSPRMVRWGVASSAQPIVDAKMFKTIPFDYKDYRNAKDFTIDCAKRSLIEAFRAGITVAMEKIKFKMCKQKNQEI
ncbi:MAG: immunity 9 family protein [Helicobacteraceae bacterium]|jgi:hypothetical protein|nr:immunity 9 family protein [Helicobacteraceae bacterium]